MDFFIFLIYLDVNHLAHLFSGHGQRVDLVSLLHQGTERATHDGEAVVEGAAHEIVLLPDLPSDLDPGDEVEDGHEHGQGALDARLVHLLSVLPLDVAWGQPGDDAHAAVVEAAEQAVFELGRHVVVDGCLLQAHFVRQYGLEISETT